MDQLIGAAVGLLGLLIWALIAYVVIKAAVKNGIKESGLLGRLQVGGGGGAAAAPSSPSAGGQAASAPGRADGKRHGFLDNPFSAPTRPAVPPEMAKIHAQVKKLN
jgi:hypothetical protein